ncbi:MAG: PQQ-dependent sugar dehydrogenase [Planctomycetes bacterium]|nr:PQQ-dependent sugar dehydrogenase [Planctomycetota bacterium]
MSKRIRLVAGTLALCLLVSGTTTNAGGTELATIRVASGLTRPLFVTHAPGDADRIYIVEKPGRIKVLKGGVVSVFLDITARVGGSGSLNSEQGLFALAFHPDFANNSFFYVNYTNNGGDTRVSRFTANDADNGDSGSEFVILSISQPQSNHNGGWLAFGPNDGFLYIATGDGGDADDEGFGHTAGTGNGQDITNNLLGKMLRIDVDGGSPYAIPPDNPFVGITGDDEIWAYGLRNPWRNAFDPSTGDLYIADVGQNAWEEISFQPASSTGGENYGWRCREGAHDFNISANCAGETFVDPIHEYSHGGSPFRCSITGGEIYHGSEIPDLVGTYFYADWCSDSIWSFRVVGGVVTEFEERTAELTPGGGLSIVNITSFGTDANGEMYICDHSTGNGEVFKIVPRGPQPPLRAQPPHDILKNRYISVDPTGGGLNPSSHHIRVMVDSSEVNDINGSGPWWAGQPNAKCVSVVTTTKPASPPDWSSCTAVHLTGCAIVPTTTYSIVAESAAGESSTAVLLDTQAKPGVKWHGDTVGFFDGMKWTPPNGTTSIDDAVAAIKTFQDPSAFNATHLSVSDVHPNLDGTEPNLIVSIADVFVIILGFQGLEYPGPDLTQCP